MPKITKPARERAPIAKFHILFAQNGYLMGLLQKIVPLYTNNWLNSVCAMGVCVYVCSACIRHWNGSGSLNAKSGRLSASFPGIHFEIARKRSTVELMMKFCCSHWIGFSLSNCFTESEIIVFSPHAFNPKVHSQIIINIWNRNIYSSRVYIDFDVTILLSWIFLCLYYSKHLAARAEFGETEFIHWDFSFWFVLCQCHTCFKIFMGGIPFFSRISLFLNF